MPPKKGKQIESKKLSIKPDIFLIIIDTLRKDYAKPLEEALEKEGFISYENAIAPAPWTIPSHVSMVTGLYPSYHKAHETKEKKEANIKFKETKNTLYILLKKRGYHAFLLSSDPYISPTIGFKTFDLYRFLLEEPQLFNLTEKEKTLLLGTKFKTKNKIELVKEFLKSKKFILLIKLILNKFTRPVIKRVKYYTKNWPKEKGSKKILRELKKILQKEERKTPKFFMINFMEVHEPYYIGDYITEKKGGLENLKNGKLDLLEIEKTREHYKKEVEYITKRIVEFIEILKKHEIFDSSLIIVTSDHGQLLGEHGRLGHQAFLDDEVLRVPLLVKYPKGSEPKIKKEKGFISLTKIKDLILHTIDKKKKPLSLYTEPVFAESYGTEMYIDKRKLTEEEKHNIEQLEKYRIAIYHENYKGIFNVENWKWEELKNYKGGKVPKQKQKEMEQKIAQFLEKGTKMKRIKRLKNRI